MHIIVATLFLMTTVLAFIEDRLKNKHKIIILCLFAVFMVFLATTKDIKGTADAGEYEHMFYQNDDILVELTTEPTYIYLSRIVLALGGSVVTMFLIYALITIPAKVKMLNDLTKYIFTALMIYLPIYFEVHDLIQIRAAAAATFLIASMLALCRKYYILAVAALLVATTFHYSAIAFLPFLLIGNRKYTFRIKIAVAMLVPIGFAMYFMKLDLLSFIPSSLVGGKLDFYRNAAQTGEWSDMTPPYRNIYFMVKCILLYMSLYYYDLIVAKEKYAPMMISVFAGSIFIMLSMATIPVISSRISDLYGIIDCIVFTYALYMVNPKYVARIAIMCVGLYMLYYNMTFTEYFT